MDQAWRTVRIFISSTFRDMHAERDHLVKIVFPELRERMARRRLHLIDIDLRWGVTEEEVEQGKVLDICLDEINRSRPFFIGILGERYGIVPDDVPDDIRFAHPWLAEYPEHSLTSLEIIHGVLRNPEIARRSFFYFRNPRFISEVPENKRADYMAESSEAAGKLKKLKDKIRASGRPVMENYPCCWDDASCRIVDLDRFGQQVLEDLWSAICAEYPEEVPEADPIAVERQMHEAFAEERSRLHIGRFEQFKLLTEYVRGTDRRPVVITGESGCGKSAFLATWSRKYAAENPDDFILAYFVGASPDSTNHFRLLRNICQEVKREFNLKEEIPQEDKKLSETLALLLMSASRDKSRIILIIDALDQLSSQEAAHGLGWLLDYMPEKVRLVVSSLEGDCLDVLQRQDAEEIVLPPLNVEEQRQIVQVLLGEWRRKLDERQMAALLAHPGVDNPLYLRVALEELRLFGKFEELTMRIHSLAEDVGGLFDQVLARLEEDHGKEMVSEAFSLVGSSRYGLSETELLDLLRREGEEQLPRALWLRLSRGAKAYLVQRVELIGFFHRQLLEAVTSRYLIHENKHATLAAYFKLSSFDRKLDEYPYQLQRSEKWEELATALSDPELFEYGWNRNREYEWMAYWHSMKGQYEPQIYYKSTIDAILARGKMIEAAILSNLIGILLNEMALLSYASYFFSQSLELGENLWGPDHPEVAIRLNNIAELYRDQGRYAEAEQLNKRALIIYEKVLRSDHPDMAAAIGMATSIGSLASLYFDQKRYAEAEPLYIRALKIKEKVLGPDHPDVASSTGNLGLLYRSQGRYAEAEPLCRRALKIKEKVLGPDHPDVASSIENLALLYYDQGRYAEAEPLYIRALKIKEKALGPNHLDVAASLNNLGLLYYDQGRYAEAEPLYIRALKIKEKVLGPDHPNVASSLGNLALLYRSQGRYLDAEPLYIRALKISQKTLGPDQPDAAASLHNLGSLYHEQGRYAEAEALYIRALKIWEKVLGPDHPNVAKSMYNLAVICDDQGRYAEAEALYMRALKIWEKILGPDHPNVAIFLNDLGSLYHEQGRYTESEPLYQQALKIAENNFGPDHPNTEKIRKNLKDCQDAIQKN